MKRVNVVYCLPGMVDETPVEFFAGFRDTLWGAKNAGYHVGVADDTTATRSELLRQLGWSKCFSLRSI